MKFIKWLALGAFLIVGAVIATGAIFISTLDLEQYRDLIEAEAYKATGRKLTLAGPIDLELSLNPTLVVEDATFANAAWGSRPVMASFKRLEFQAALMPLLQRSVQITKLVLVEPDILIETRADGTGNWAIEPVTTDDGNDAEGSTGNTDSDPGSPTESDNGSRDVALGVDSLVIENGQFIYRDGATGEENVIRLTRLEASAPNTASPIDLSANLDIDGKAIALSGTIGAIDVARTAPYPIDLSIEAGGANLTVDGLIGDLAAAQGLDLNISVNGDDLAALGAFVGSDLPDAGRYDATFHLTQNGSVYNLNDLSAKLGDNDIAGSASVDTGRAKPAVSAQLTSTRFDLESLSPAQSGADGQIPGAGAAGTEGAEGTGGSTPSTGNSRYVFTEDPLPLEALDSADADIKLTVETLRIDEKMQAENVDLTLSLSGGRLRLNPLTMTFYGGDIQTWADVNTGVPGTPIALKVIGNRIDYGTLLEVFGDENSFAGMIDIDANFTSRGNSLRQIASNLNGPIKIEGQDGTIDNRWLRALTGGVSDILGPLFGGQRTSRLHCVLYTAETRNGVMAVDGIALDSEVFTLFGSGAIDLRDETLDLAFNSGTRQAAVSSLVPPFTVQGTLKDPKVRADVVDAVSGFAQALGGITTVEDALAIFSGAPADPNTATTGSGLETCYQAVEASNQPAEAPQNNVVDGATDRLVEGIGEAIESGDLDKLEDAAEDALEGLKGLFGR